MPDAGGHRACAELDRRCRKIRDPRRAADLVGDDIDADIAGAQAHGMKTVLVRTGKFRPDAVERGNVRPDGIVSSIAQLPDWLEQNV